MCNCIFLMSCSGACYSTCMTTSLTFEYKLQFYMEHVFNKILLFELALEMMSS